MPKSRKPKPGDRTADAPDEKPGQSDGRLADRRAASDRRAGRERRAMADRREPGDRRDGRERRSGRDRRTCDIGPPPGCPERRSGTDRRVGQRRSGRDRRDEANWEDLALDAVGVKPFEGEDRLVDAARAARGFARARFSAFRVGAAIETIDGHIFTGCNVENASYGLTICAERVALVKALSEGHDVFTRLAVVTEAGRPTAPCGACRQLLWEYSGDIQIILASPTKILQRHQLGRLLPVPFDHTSLE